MTELEDLAVGCRILGTCGHDDVIFGHASVRSDGESYWMKGAGLGLEETAPDDLVRVARDGSLLNGRRRRHAEYPIHAEIYAARSDVGAVVHTHPPFGVVVGALNSPLRPIGHEGSFFAPAGVAKFTVTSDLIVTPELGAAVATTLGSGRAVLLRNHGIVTVGRNIHEAVVAALVLEKACYIQALVPADADYSWTDPAEAESKRQRMYSDDAVDSMWHYYVRRLTATQRQGPQQ